MIVNQDVLLVEDNDDDAELTIMAFEEARITNPIVRVRDGIEALDYLLRRGDYATRQSEDLPAIALVDLKMPRMGGLELLHEIRKDPKLKRLPIVVLTSSSEESDRIAAYDEYANSYVRKPVDYDHFVVAARQLGLYWTVLNMPPPEKR